ncbi:diguanylate cyclase domain-containing protein [Caldisericum exile]|uniref:Signaling protein n=1 Tax=Caldisericum exile (strain DSM 21853 / NBRC 104410 / AZM16c01) TaxID=511051 RepID=A0A7U6JDX5_CALEA|nr:diguanylate cyclase [Caldisericum exile]BAL80136.1 putative signaling protein [Caldisericum exile AZM16c01]
MEVNPYAVFVFKRKVKTMRGLLKGELKEEKNFFKTLSLKKVKTLNDLAKQNNLILRGLKAFSILNGKVQYPFNINNNEYIFEITEYSYKPYSIILRLVSQDIITIFREMNYDLPIATVLLNNNSKIIDVNPQFENLFGFKGNEIIGKDLNELIVPKNELKDGYSLDNIAKDTGYVRVERKRLTKNGREIPVLVSGSPLKIGEKTIGIIGVYEDIRDIKKVQEALYYQATHDVLTGLPNRYLLEDRFNIEKARADRLGSKVALFFVDINRFKDINDTYGHDIGDRVIKYVAHKLLSSVRSTDSVVRFGGDEFVIVFDEVKEIEDIVSIAMKVVDAFSLPFKFDEYTIDVGINVGIAIYPDDSATLEELLRKGDIAMYEAKVMGTNNFVFYSKEIEEERLKTLSDLKARDIMFRLVFEKSPLPQIIIDDEFRVLRVNESFKKVFKIDLRKIYGKKLVEVEGFEKLLEFLQKDMTSKEIEISSVKFCKGMYNLKYSISCLKSLGRTYYLIVFKEVWESGSE